MAVTTMERVHELLSERDMSLLKLSRIGDVSYSTLRATEKRNGELSVDTIERICRALGITMAQFFAVWEGDRSCETGKRS